MTKQSAIGFALVMAVASAPGVAASDRVDSSVAVPILAEGGAKDDIEYAQAFRAELGFPSDMTTVLDRFADPAADMSFGTPLSAAELKNLEHRWELREEAAPLVSYVNGMPEEFGGIYFAQDSGELVVNILPVASGHSTVRDKAVALIPDGLPANVRIVEYSTVDLTQALERTSSRFEELGINEVGIDVAQNRLDVVFAPGSSTMAAVNVSAVPISTSFGTGPTPAVCVDSSNCRPYRGGIGYLSTADNYLCTWGFYGTRGAAAKYVISAGHCSKLGHTLEHLGATFTDGVDRDTFDLANNNQDADALTAHVKSSVYAVAPFNTIYVNDANKAYYISGIRGSGPQTVGDQVCFEGGATGHDLCGVIEAEDLAYPLHRFDGKILNVFHQFRMSRVAKVGDSGGPVYWNHTAYGLVSALNNGDSHLLYTGIDYAQGITGTTVCTTASC